MTSQSPNCFNLMSTSRIFSTNFDRIASEVRRALPRGTEVCIRKKLGLIAWKTLGQIRFVYLLQFNRIIYQFSLGPNQNNLPAQITGATDPNKCPRYYAELNFHYSETPLIRGTDLVRFVEDCFRFPTQPQDIYRWPLFFASGRWKLRLAWTTLAQSEQKNLPLEARISKPIQPSGPQPKHKFNPEPRTKKTARGQ